MPSAIISFSDNFQDVEDLVEVHGTMGGAGPGRRWNLAALNKAAIVLTCAIWEAFVEDLVDEAVGHIAQQLTVPANLPLQLRKRIAKKIKEDSHELSPWTLAGTGWQSVLRNSAADLVSRTAGSLNTPKSPQLRNLFNDTLGIADITSSWRRHRMTPTQAAKKLDDFIVLRRCDRASRKGREFRDDGSGKGFYEFGVGADPIHRPGRARSRSGTHQRRHAVGFIVL